MFGNTSFNNTSFGSTTPFGGSVFGGTPSLGSPFGSASQQASQPAGPVGTTIRFVPIQGTEPVQKPGTGTSSTVITRHQNISAMKEYESKSVDELRLEDYAANRKVGQTSPFQVGPFNTSSNTTSLFNNTSTTTNPPFGGTSNIFNNAQQKPGFSLGSSPGTSLFNTGAVTTTTASNASPFNIGTTFNTSANSTSLFGNTSNNTNPPFGSNTSIFNTSQQKPGFMNPTPGLMNPAPGPSLFNTSSNTTSLFNNTSTTTNPPFGGTSNIFNNAQQKPGFSLGSSPGTSLFNTGAVTTTTASNASPFNIGTTFNTSANTTSLFGNATNNTPNSTNPPFGGNTSIFNTSQQKPGFMNPTPGPSLFNTTSNTNSLFNNTSTTTNPPFGGTSNIFNNTQQKPGFNLGSSPGTSLFNTGAVTTTTTAASTTSPFNFGTTFNTSANTTSLFGNTSNNTNPPFGSNTSIFNTSQQKPGFMNPTPGPSLFNTTSNTNSLFNNTSTTINPTFGGTSNIFNNTQQKPGFNLGSSPGTSLFNTGAVTTTTTAASTTSPFNFGTTFNTSANTTSLFGITSNDTNPLFGTNTSILNTTHQKPESISFTTDLKTVNKYKMKAKTDIKLNKEDERTSAAMVLFDTEDDPSEDLRCAIEIFPPKRNIKKLDLTLNSDYLDERSGFISTRPDYKIDPTLEEIERCYDPKNDTCIINSLLIDRPEYGSILFDSPLDVKGLNLDEIVFIRRKEVVVYPDDENKPPYGHGLNRPAIISLHQVWPIDKSTNQMIKDADRLNLMKYSEKIKSITAEKDARFIDYRPQTGTWVFSVKHFSKYGISDDDDVEFVPIQQQPQSQDSTISSQGMAANSIISNTSFAEPILFEGIEDQVENHTVEKFTLVHKSKKLALPGSTPVRRPQITPTTSIAYPTIMSSVPKQPKTRDLKIVPDLFAARNMLSRDIMSVCVAGSPKVNFFNGSRKFCVIRGNAIVVNELNLIPTSTCGTLEDKTRERLERFLDSYSLITTMNMKPTLAPYIETHDYIPDAASYGLLHALYGNLSSKTPYAKQDERLSRVIDWLASTNLELPKPEGLYSQIIHHMSCDRYDLASNLAIDNNHPRLALLVATLNLNKDYMLEQLSSWRLSTADQYIDPELFKIYVLLAGLTEWKLSNDETIYCLKGLKWTQQMCLMILHVTAYDAESENYGFLLLPSYIDRLDSDTDDVDYHILARHNPCEILSSANTLLDEWFLLESLKSFHVINSETECMNSDVVHCNLASQLAAIDLRWACFVALHIMNNEIRNQVLVKCLEQNHSQLMNAEKGSKSVESWLVEKLNVPLEFIASSKSVASVK